MSQKMGLKVTEDVSDSYEVSDEFCQIQNDDAVDMDKIQVVECINDFIASPFEIMTRDVEDDLMYISRRPLIKYCSKY